MLNIISRKRFYTEDKNHNHAAQCLTIAAGTEHSLPNRNIRIHVKSGIAWITSNGEDIIASNGDRVYLQSGKHSSIISSLDDQPVTFEIEAR
ncbi:MAG TPA: hypothetical protein VJZ27_06085 [Aggregatilineales bacterium]|nr:hypothetical protein [Aggregatilineales bacterium]